MPVDESEEYETVAGWVLASSVTSLCRASATSEKEPFRVQTMRRSRIARIRVTAGHAPGDRLTRGDAESPPVGPGALR